MNLSAPESIALHAITPTIVDDVSGMPPRGLTPSLVSRLAGQVQGRFRRLFCEVPGRTEVWSNEPEGVERSSDRFGGWLDKARRLRSVLPEPVLGQTVFGLLRSGGTCLVVVPRPTGFVAAEIDFDRDPAAAAELLCDSFDAAPV